MLRAIFISLAMIAFAHTANAQMALPTPGQKVSFNACLSIGPENCLIARDIKTGMRYDVNAAKPRPKPRPLIARVTGVLMVGPSTCFLPILRPVTIHFTKMRCPKQ
jgi:hypothetical protein